MKFAQVSRLSAAVLASVLAANASADLNFNGFISVGAGATTDGDRPLYGYDDEVSFKPDTLMGLQAMADLGEGFSATTQLIARGEENYDLSAEWAYLTYQAAPAVRINAGRQRMPLYIYSDYLDVGYAYHWVSAPESFYNAPISAFNGLSVDYSRYLGDWEAGLQLVGGSASEEDLRGTGFTYSTDLDQYVGAVATLGYGPVTFRATFQQAQQHIDGGIFDLFSGVSAAVAGLDPELAGKLDMGKIDLTFAGLGLSIDWANILFVAEAREQSYKDNVIPTERAYYASLAYRLGDFMPYLTVERAEGEIDRDAQAQLMAAAAAGVPSATVRQVIGAMNALDEDARIYTLGLRYNVHPSAALKVEYTKNDDHRDQATLPAGTGGDVSLVRVAIDAVF